VVVDKQSKANEQQTNKQKKKNKKKKTNHETNHNAPVPLSVTPRRAALRRPKGAVAMLFCIQNVNFDVVSISVELENNNNKAKTTLPYACRSSSDR
jgi:hypothetical protein